MNFRKLIAPFALVVLVGVILIIILPGNPGWGSGRITTVRIAATKSEETAIAAKLKQLLSSTPPPLFSDNQAIHRAVLASTDTNVPIFKPRWTNAAGEALDMWGTPYQIQIVHGTNFVIRSAGKNCILGDKDDVIFDSLDKRKQ